MLIGIVPVFNEEETIIGVLNKLEKQLGFLILVNDGSSDSTDFLISDWLKNRKGIHYISYKRNRGMACALLRGFNYIRDQYKKEEFSSEDIIITIDADGQHDADQIQGMYEYFNNNKLDVLIAQRDLSDYPYCRIFANKLLSLAASFLGRFKFNDIECGFKFLKLAFVINLLNYYTGYRYSCGGEIGIAASLLGYKVDNHYKIYAPYLRDGRTTLADFFIDIFFYFFTYLKIKLRRIST